jgi:hypothetical protein
MTKAEFLDQFALQYDEINSLGAPHLTPAQIGALLSKVQEDLVILKYGPKSNPLKEGLEETEKRIQDLGELVAYKTYTSFTNGFFDNSYDVVLPNTLVTNNSTDYSDVFWFPIYEGVVTNTDNCAKTDKVKARVEEAKHTPLELLLKDPFSRPFLKNDDSKVLRLRSTGRTHTLLTDGSFTIQKYKLGYIKKPKPVDLTTALTSQVSELSEHIHRELVEETVKLALKIGREQEQFVIQAQPNTLNKE